MAVTPAGAEVSTAVATSWKKIWKKNLRPLADKRYYTKAQSDAKYQPKGAYEAAGSGTARPRPTARPSPTRPSSRRATTRRRDRRTTRLRPTAGQRPTRSTQPRDRPTPRQSRTRGMHPPPGRSAEHSSRTRTCREPASSPPRTSPSRRPWRSRPIVHVVDGAVPAGCSGSASAPDASPGHLCIFVSGKFNVSALYTCKNGATSCTGGADGSADPWGLTMYADVPRGRSRPGLRQLGAQHRWRRGDLDVRRRAAVTSPRRRRDHRLRPTDGSTHGERPSLRGEWRPFAVLVTAPGDAGSTLGT